MLFAADQAQASPCPSVGLMSLPSEPVTIPEHRRDHTAIQRVPLPTEDVIFYMVGSS